MSRSAGLILRAGRNRPPSLRAISVVRSKYPMDHWTVPVRFAVPGDCRSIMFAPIYPRRDRLPFRDHVSVNLMNHGFSSSHAGSCRTTDEPGCLSRVVLDPAATQNAITHDQVVVYFQVGDHQRRAGCAVGDGSSRWPRISASEACSRRLVRRVATKGRSTASDRVGGWHTGWGAGNC